MSRRRAPQEDVPEEERRARQRFWNGPRGWALTAVAVAALVGLSFLSPIATLAVFALLVVAEVVDSAHRWSGPWLVEATAAGGPRPDIVWRAADRRRSREVADEVAGALERGQADMDVPAAERLLGPA